MFMFILRRIGAMLATMVALTFIVFYLVNLPGNLEKIAKTEGNMRMTDEQVAGWLEKEGYSRPFLVRYGGCNHHGKAGGEPAGLGCDHPALLALDLPLVPRRRAWLRDAPSLRATPRQGLARQLIQDRGQPPGCPQNPHGYGITA